MEFNYPDLLHFALKALRFVEVGDGICRPPPLQVPQEALTFEGKKVQQEKNRHESPSSCTNRLRYSELHWSQNAIPALLRKLAEQGRVVEKTF